MTKNQVNYLLVLATLVVLWLYLNMFATSGAMLRRSAGGSRRNPAAMTMPPRGGASFMPRSGMPSMEDLKKMAAAQTAQRKLPTPVVAEEKK